MKSTQPNQRLRRVISMAIFCCGAAILLGWIAYYALVRRAIAREIATAQNSRDALHAVVQRWEADRRWLESKRKRSEDDARLIFNVLGHCRSAEDIPDLSSNRIVSHHPGQGELRFYIPEGKHTLEITSGWKPQDEPTGETPAVADRKQKRFTTAKGWSVPLLPSSGYHLQLHTDRKGGSPRWVLSSNQVDFETREASLSLAGFQHRGSSWSDFNVLMFPNQVEQLSTREIEAAAVSPPGVQLLDLELRGVIEKRPHVVNFAVRVISEGPACVSAQDAYRLMMMGREDLLYPHDHQGKYQLKSRSRH